MTTTTLDSGHAPGHAAHHDDPAAVRDRQRLAVLLLIAADAAFVLSLVFTYFYLRALNTEGGWLPQGAGTVSVVSGWVIAGIVVVSAAAYRWGERGIRAGRQERLLAGLVVALALVLADGVLQAIQLASLPMPTTQGAYASSFIVLSGYHLVHLMLTTFLGLGVINRARLGKFTAAQHGHVEVVGLWWMWVAVSALLTALTTSFITA